jgi:hypothetical protein
MNDLLKQLYNALRHTRAGAMDQAVKHIDEAWDSVDDVLSKRVGHKFTVRTVLGHLSEARFAAMKGDQQRTTFPVEAVMGSLDEGAAEERRNEGRADKLNWRQSAAPAAPAAKDH